MVSIKEIAEIAGVSRGTVDRVVNGRGGVSPETSKRILEIIEEKKYTPNRLGKQLAVTKKNLKFGAILYGYSDENPYFGQVEDALLNKTKHLVEYGIELEIRHTEIDEPDEMLKNINDLVEKGITGLILSPVDTPLIREKINELQDCGIQVVTIGTDIPETNRMAYVGSNSYKFGMIAGNLMGLFTQGLARTGIITGSEYSYNHIKKVQGFCDYLTNNYPDSVILAKAVNHDRDEESYACVKGLLSGENTGINSVYFSAGGVRGGCQAIKDCGMAGKIAVVSFDLMPFNIQMVREGVIFATIGQQPEYQAEKALDLLVDFLGMGICPARKYFYSVPEIRVRSNFV